MTELPGVSSADDQPEGQPDQAENESGEESPLIRDTNELTIELRRDLETMRNAHRLIVKEIKSIQREFKELVRKAQEQNSVCSDFGMESVSEYTTDYSTETDDSTSCTEGDINGAINRKLDLNKITLLRNFASNLHSEESKKEDLENLSKIVDEQRKNMFVNKGSHFLSTKRRGSSMTIELDRNRRLNTSLLDEERHFQKKTAISMPRRNSAMPHVQYFASPRETRRDGNNIDNQRMSSNVVEQLRLTHDRQLKKQSNHTALRKPAETSLKNSRTATGTSSLQRLDYKRGSLSVEVGHDPSHGYSFHNGHRRASEMLPNHVGSLFSPPTGNRWVPELRTSTDTRRTSVLLEEDEISFQEKRVTSL